MHIKRCATKGPGKRDFAANSASGVDPHCHRSLDLAYTAAPVTTPFWIGFSQRYTRIGGMFSSSM